MTVHEVIHHFDGIPGVAKALGISYQAVQQWADKGRVPMGRQWELQALTDGKLKVSNGQAA